MIICPSFYDGHLDGIGRVSKMVYETFRKIDHTPQILSANDSLDQCPPGKNFCYARNYPMMMGAASIQRFHPPKLIVCMHLGLAPVARLIGLRYQTPYLVFLHGIEAWQAMNFRRKWGLLKAHRLLSNSNFTLRHFQAFNPAFSHIPTVVTPLGTGGGKLEEERQMEAKPRILIVGRLDQAEQYKGHRLLIRSLGLILDKNPATRLTVVGDGNDRRNLEAFANQFPYQQQIEFLGKVSDSELCRLYEESMVFAMPSKGEGFGLVYLEAMAHGLPCICSDVDAAREVVVHGESGFIVDPSNPFDLAERILQLLGQPELRRRMGQAGKERYLEYFTEDHFQTRLRKVFTFKA